MDNTKFKVGDRVVTTKSYQGLNKGHTGVIIRLRKLEAGIEVDNWNGGHNCGLGGSKKNGYWVRFNCLSLDKITNWKGEFQ